MADIFGNAKLPSSAALFDFFFQLKYIYLHNALQPGYALSCIDHLIGHYFLS